MEVLDLEVDRPIVNRRGRSIGNMDLSLAPDFYGVSDVSKFTPIYAPFTRSKTKILNSGTKACMMYGLPILPKSNLQINRYNEVYEHLTKSVTPANFLTANVDLVIMKGCMYDRQSLEILMCVGIESNHLCEVNRSHPDTNNILCFVSSSMDSDKYKSVHNKFKKEYFPYYLEKGIDIVYTKDVNKWVFQDGFEIPKFDTIKSMKEHLDTINEEIEFYE